MRPACVPAKYEILGELGSGGMGLVYHARDRVLGREVALKVMSHQFAADPVFVQRFQTEARAAARLNHPHIVQIYDFGETGGSWYLAMELVRGRSLKAELKEVGRFSESRTLALVLVACRTLEAAHRAGIVHRDVKPDNMMFGDGGAFKLVDLGLAKNLREDAGHTATGQSLGTPHFISPEQILGARVIDQRADIYSLGATMYNLATGAVPFDGTSGAHIMSRHLHDPLPDPRLVAAELSAGFCQVLGRMMAKDPADRYQDMGALERDLLALQQGRAPEAAQAVPSAVQQTVFLRAPAGPAPALAAHRLEAASRRLAEEVGPLARVLVARAAARAGSWGELVAALVASVPAEPARAAFREDCLRLGEGGGTSVAAAPVGEASDPDARTIALSAAAPAPWGLATDDQARLTALLAGHIGPVAATLVRRELKRAAGRDDLVARLADAIPERAGRAAFIAAAG